MAGGFGGGFDHGHAFVMTTGSVINRQQVFKPTTFGEGSYHIKMEMGEPFIGHWKLVCFTSVSKPVNKRLVIVVSQTKNP